MSETTSPTLPALPMRDGGITIAALIDTYMAHYAGRDGTRLQRLGWWSAQLGQLTLAEVSDDHLHVALESLTGQAARFYAGKDADGRPIHKAKRRPMAPATVNRYAASISAVFTWAIRRRVAPKAWDHPGRRIERRPENNEKIRFLTDDECTRLLEACKASTWPLLNILVLLALTTGARKGELLGLTWADVDLAHGQAHVGRSKNGDPKVLPLVPAAVDQLQRLRPASGAGLVFLSARNPSQAYSFEPKFHEALRAAKIKGVTFHTLRHSCASMLAKNGATLLEIADLLGHRQLQMTKRYAHLATTHRTALVNRLLGELA